MANYLNETVEQRADRLVRQEVIICLSSLVHTLAKGCDFTDRANDAGRDLQSICEQAFELASPVPDYEEAAWEAGWREAEKPQEDGTKFYLLSDFGSHDTAQTWQELCDAEGIEPYDREVFEHWAVTGWLADKLIEKGEKVDQDFAGMNVWARTTTGQAISMDHVIQTIAADRLKD